MMLGLLPGGVNDGFVPPGHGSEEAFIAICSIHRVGGGNTLRLPRPSLWPLIHRYLPSV